MPLTRSRKTLLVLIALSAAFSAVSCISRQTARSECEKRLGSAASKGQLRACTIGVTEVASKLLSDRKGEYFRNGDEADAACNNECATHFNVRSVNPRLPREEFIAESTRMSEMFTACASGCTEALVKMKEAWEEHQRRVRNGGHGF